MNSATTTKHTAEPWHIKQAFTVSQSSGREVRAGWDLFHGDDWSQRYPNRKEAKAALKRVIALRALGG